jgi:glycosyltransferase involved in cell wall biosynthesis
LTELNTSYHLVHVVGGGEHKTPLVASQVFDRAQEQAVTAGEGKPLSVSVWIFVPMRMAFEKESKAIIEGLRKRCPDVTIKAIPGINRLGQWPSQRVMKGLRKKLKGPVVYHCRSEMFIDRILPLKKEFPGDAVVLDIRGFFPLERFINDHSINGVADMNEHQQGLYNKDLDRLKFATVNSEVVCTVSEPLRDYLIQQAGAGKDTVVIPCCVKNTVDDAKRADIRKELKIENKTAILYLGGVHKNQYLEELGIPFIKTALALSDKYAGVFITQNKDKMMALLAKFNVEWDNIRVISVPQNEVGDYLTGMDLGLLLRAPSVQNNFSQPVKFGEYLSAGIPVVLEEGTGKISELLQQNGIGCVVKLWGKENQKEFEGEVRKALDWFETNKTTVRENARKFVDDCYTWKANVQKEREMYANALQKAVK